MTSSCDDFPKNCKPHNSRLDIDLDDPSIQAFLKKSKKFDRVISSKMEIEFVRVLEDLIEVLIKNDVILISDFNNEVIKKLALRKSLRERLALIDTDIQSK